MERINTYKKWLEKEGLPVIRDCHSIPDLMEVPLKPWPRTGGSGVHINLIGAEGETHSYLCEIPPGGSLLPERHVYEEIIYVLSGYGAATVWVEGEAKQSFEWQEGSLFSPPLNSWHQLFNGQSDKPARFFGVTRAPVFMNLFHDLDFIFHNDFFFRNRYQWEEGFFSHGRLVGEDEKDEMMDNPKLWRSSFIPDVRSFGLVDDPARGGLSNNARYEFADGMMSGRITEEHGGTYMKAHHHNGGSHLICLTGQGYTLMWPSEGGPLAKGVERVKINWKKNTVFAVVDKWFHQHFSTGKEPGRIMSFSAERSVKYEGIRPIQPRAKSIKRGGTQIEYEDEDPEIRRLFKEELAKTGLPWQMSKFFPGE